MTFEEANELHNPFVIKGKFRSEIQIVCTESKPDLSLFEREAVILTFPNQEWINIAAKAESITSLFIDRPKAKDLSPIGALYLKNFTASYPSHVKDWSFLRRLTSLLRLSLHNTLPLRDLEDVRFMSQLEVLQLSGGYGKDLQLPSLAPLGDLKNLRVVDLAAVRFSDWSLSPLFRLSKLRRFDCPLNWPKDELAELLRRNPKVCSSAI